MKKHRECLFRHELDVMTLVCTRGRDFPLSLLQDRMRCPRCGSRRVRIAWQIPSGADRRSAASFGL